MRNYFLDLAEEKEKKQEEYITFDLTQVPDMQFDITVAVPPFIPPSGCDPSVTVVPTPPPVTIPSLPPATKCWDDWWLYYEGTD